MFWMPSDKGYFILSPSSKNNTITYAQNCEYTYKKNRQSK